MRRISDSAFDLVMALHGSRRDMCVPQSVILVAERVAIQALEADGLSWDEIGFALGISAAHARVVFEAFEHPRNRA